MGIFTNRKQIATVKIFKKIRESLAGLPFLLYICTRNKKLKL